MSHPLGFRMVRIDGPRIFSCDICTQPLDGPWSIQTLVGDVPQSDLCNGCANDVTKIVQGVRMAAARAARATTAVTA